MFYLWLHRIPHCTCVVGSACSKVYGMLWSCSSSVCMCSFMWLSQVQLRVYMYHSKAAVALLHQLEWLTECLAQSNWRPRKWLLICKVKGYMSGVGATCAGYGHLYSIWGERLPWLVLSDPGDGKQHYRRDLFCFATTSYPGVYLMVQCGSLLSGGFIQYVYDKG